MQLNKIIRIFIMFLCGALLFACGEANKEAVIDNSGNVKFNAAFSKIKSVTIFDENGVVLENLLDGEREVYLNSGRYYVDIRDDYGNSVFDEYGRLLFAVKAEGAELSLEPQEVSGIDIPLVALYVGDVEAEENENLHEAKLYSGAPTGDRGRLLWEATLAMVPSGSVDSEDWSPAVNMYATNSYVNTDVGAWNFLRNAYGTNVCCRNDNDTTNNYTPCYLTYGADNVSQYVYQGNYYRGGQCKAFSNLVAYRSGVFHGNNYAFKMLPNDTWIASNCNNTSPSTIQAGDVLRSTTYKHSLIVARVFSSTSVMVIDSNWVGGDGNERVASHPMSFSGSGISDLDNYKVISCIYNNNCP